MIQTLRLSDFTNAFRNSDRKDQFSYEAQTILFDYFEALEDDLGTPIEFDMIGICCEWAEDTPENIAAAYDIDTNGFSAISGGKLLMHVYDWLENKTQIAGVTEKNTIVYCSSF
jgi:hypothetical protein